MVRGVGWASAYAMNARLADRYRAGRVFLMGDAAHTHPPTGGRGLNTSVGRLQPGLEAGRGAGGAPEALLDTYEAERRPIAAEMLDLATDLLKKAGQGDMRRGREVHQLDSSAIRRRPCRWRPPERQGGVRAGDRAPDALLRGAGGQPRRLFDLLQGPH